MTDISERERFLGAGVVAARHVEAELQRVREEIRRTGPAAESPAR
ncbi:MULTISPECIES: hypothetical protein [Mycolicibacterium]|nr:MULTISPECIES: hypothetical protein [Mycolicibacterium]MCW1820805.1 hypothetical protein [Mycolicibacterium senegalense]